MIRSLLASSLRGLRVVFPAIPLALLFPLLFAALPSCSLFSDSSSTGSVSGANTAGIVLTLTCTESPNCTHETGIVKVTFSGLPGNANDAITLSPQGSPDGNAVAYQYTQGAKSGTLSFTRVSVGIPLVARAFINGLGYTAAAESPLPALMVTSKSTVSLSCPTPHCYRTSALTITYHGLPGNTYDSVIVTPTEGSVYDRLSFLYTGGLVDGSMTVNNGVPANTPRFPNRQPLVARIFEGGLSGPQIAVSDPLTLESIDDSDSPSLKVQCGACQQSDTACVCHQSDTVKVTYSDFPGFAADTITILPEGHPDGGEPFPYQRVNPQVDGTLTFTGLMADDYLVARAYKNGGPTRIVESAHFKLAGDQTTVGVSCSDPTQPNKPSTTCMGAPRSSKVTVTYANMPGYFYDVITFAPVNAPLSSHFGGIQWTQGAIAGTLAFDQLPSGVSIEARAFRDYSANGTTILAGRSAPFTLAGDGPTLLLSCNGSETATPPATLRCKRTSTVTVTYSGMPGYFYDLIAFYKPGAALGNGFTSWKYTYGVVDGTMDFTDLPTGQLVARGFKNLNFSDLVKESDDVITIEGDPGIITVGCAPHCLENDDIVVKYSNLQSFYYSMIYAYSFPDGAIQPRTLKYTYGVSAGSTNMGKLPIGNYFVGSDDDGNHNFYARSAPFSVGPIVPVCGDGVRDPATEECDDGNQLAGDSCSATCTVTAIDVAPRAPPSDSVPLPGRTLGEGRHPVASQDKSFAVTFMQTQPTPTLSFAEYSNVGVPLGAAISIGDGTSLLSTSNAVLAALPGKRYAAAWTDLTAGTMGDGDEQGIALRLVDPAAAPKVVSHANGHADFSQFDPDIVFTGTDVIVAWVDESNPGTKRDVKYRVFTPDLTPRGDDMVLAATVDSEADVALATFAGSWAAAWRVATDAGEVVHVKAGDKEWATGPFLPGPAGVKPALSEIDDSHLLLVFTQGVDVGNTGVASGSKLSEAVLDVLTPGDTAPVDIVTRSAVAIGASRPTAAHVGSSVYIGWEAAVMMGAPVGQHVWLKEVPWSGTALDWSKGETMVPRDMNRARGDQEHLVLCETTLPVEGGILAAWSDRGMNFANAKGEIGLELNPVPMLRR